MMENKDKSSLRILFSDNGRNYLIIMNLKFFG
jgi:hypothetical protein